MKLPVAGWFGLFLWLTATAFAKDRDRFEFPPVPQKNPEADRNRAEADQAYQRGNYNRTIELTNSLLASYPTDNPHVAYHLRASALIELGRQSGNAKQIRDGINDARQALTIEGPKYAWLYIPYMYGLSSLAEIEKRPEHADLAIKVAGPVLQRQTGEGFSTEDKSQLLYQRGLAYLARSDLKAATLDFTEALKLNPVHQAANLKRAAALIQQNRTRDALAAYDEAARLFPTAMIVFNERGYLRRTTGDLDGAIADFTKALDLDKSFAVGYVNRGLCLADQNNPQAAEGDYSEALKLPVDASMKPVLFKLRAISRVPQGNATGALADYTAAIRLVPQDATLYEERGCVQFFRKDFAAATADFAKALQLDPKLTRVVPWQALALARGGKSAEARVVLDAAKNSKAAPNAWTIKLEDYLTDRIDDTALLAAAAELDPQQKSGLLCDARFFIGQKKLLATDSDAAAEQFREVLAMKAYPLTAFRGARYELNDFATK